MSEVMPMQIRARGNAFATGIGNWLVATFWAQISPQALSALTWKFYFLFAGTSFSPSLSRPHIVPRVYTDTPSAWNVVITMPIVFFFFKETKQLSLEEIDLLFGERALGALPDDISKGAEHGAVVAQHHEMNAKA